MESIDTGLVAHWTELAGGYFHLRILAVEGGWLPAAGTGIWWDDENGEHMHWQVNAALNRWEWYILMAMKSLGVRPPMCSIDAMENGEGVAPIYVEPRVKMLADANEAAYIRVKAARLNQEGAAK